MKQNNSTQRKHIALIPRMVRKIGELSANQTCAWWSHQPKVPDSMKKEIKWNANYYET